MPAPSYESRGRSREDPSAGMRPPARVRRIQALIRLAAVVLAVLGAGALAVPAGAATLVINVRAADGRPLPGAVVTIRPLDGAPRKVAPVHAVMDQVNRAFAPDLLVIPVGSTVEFPNSDVVSHQIYSFSPAKRFQLPLYRGTPYRARALRPDGRRDPGLQHPRPDARVPGGHGCRLLRPHRPRRRLHRGGAARALHRRHLASAPAGRRGRPGARAVGGRDRRADLTLRLGKSLEPAPLIDRPHLLDYKHPAMPTSAAARPASGPRAAGARAAPPTSPSRCSRSARRSPSAPAAAPPNGRQAWTRGW